MAGLVSDGYLLGGLGFGLTLAHADLNLSSVLTGLIGSASLIGIMIGSLIGGPLADRLGRKSIFQKTMPAVFFLSLLQLFVSSGIELFGIRLAIGIAIGADYAVAIPLVSELIPSKCRAPVLSLMMGVWIFSYVVAYCIACLILNFCEGASWRLILGGGTIFPLIGIIGRLGVPESPRWLVLQGNMEAATAIVHNHVGPQYEVSISGQVGRRSWKEIFSRTHRRRTFVGCMFYICQIIPYFAISIFLPNILKSLQIGNPYISGILYNVFLLIGIIIGIGIVNRISRRVFLVGSFSVCAIFLAAITLIGISSPSLALVCLSVFALAMSAAQVLQFVYPAELFPTELRASGVGFTVAISRIGGAVGTFLLPVVLQEWGMVAALSGCTGVLIIGGLVCQLYAPETAP